MSGFCVYPGLMTPEERVELLVACAELLQKGSVRDLALDYPFEGRVAELVTKLFAKIDNPTYGRFEDYEKVYVRFWVGPPKRVTPTHVDHENRVIWSAHLVGHKLWHTQECGVLDAIWNCFPLIFPNQVNGPVFYKYWDHVRGGDVSILGDYTYHTVMYLEKSFTVDVECYKRGGKLRLWRQLVPAWKTGSLPKKRLRWFMNLGFYLVNLMSLACWLARPWMIYQMAQSRHYKMAMATEGIKETNSCAPWLLEQAKKMR